MTNVTSDGRSRQRSARGSDAIQQAAQRLLRRRSRQQRRRPLCGLILAELGADVIKVEAAGGRRLRTQLGPALLGWRCAVLRCAQSQQACDHGGLSSAVEREALITLILREADAVIFNFGPGWRRSGASAQSRCSPQAVAYLLRHRRVRTRRTAIPQGWLRPADAGVWRTDEHHRRRRDASADTCSRCDDRHGSGLWAAIGILSSLLEREKQGVVDSSRRRCSKPRLRTPRARSPASRSSRNR